MGQPSDAVTGVPFFFLHFKIEEKKKVGTPVNQASRRWLHHVGPTVSAWFFLLLLFPFAHVARKKEEEEGREGSKNAITGTVICGTKFKTETRASGDSVLRLPSPSAPRL